MLNVEIFSIYVYSTVVSNPRTLNPSLRPCGAASERAGGRPGNRLFIAEAEATGAERS